MGRENSGQVDVGGQPNQVSRVPDSGGPLPLLALIWRPDGVKRTEMGSKGRFFGGICYVAHNGATPFED